MPASATVLSSNCVGSTDDDRTVSEKVRISRRGGTVLTISSRKATSSGAVVSCTNLFTRLGVVTASTLFIEVSVIRNSLNVMKVLFSFVASVVICLMRSRSSSEMVISTVGPLGLAEKDELVRVC